MTLADIKGIIRQEADQSFRYSRFLKLLQPEIDKPDRDPNWDLWFFRTIQVFVGNLRELFATRFWNTGYNTELYSRIRMRMLYSILLT
jgi:hypothetical protein